MIAEIALPVPIPKTFTYSIPEMFHTQVVPGLRVEVPFRNRVLTGVVMDVRVESETTMALKPIHSCLDLQPLLGDRDLARARQIADYYLCSLGEVLAAMMPKGVGDAKPRRARKASSPAALLWPGLLLAETSLAPRVLGKAQEEALEKIVAAIDAQREEVFLLHGVTGSGKTEIYLRATEKAVPHGTVLMLVPEIALTPQTVLRFEARFGEAVGLWHSRLSLGQRVATWEGLRNGKYQVLIGTRSAALLPIPRVSLIVLDEEHEPSYRQEDRPRYHAREVALMRARTDKIPVILGSATPSLESWQRGEEGRYTKVPLPERADQNLPAAIHLINMRHWPKGSGHLPHHISPPLEKAIKERLDRQEQVVLFLNRRGFATTIQCLECGKIFRCKRCDVAFVLHLARQKLICHYCGGQHPVPTACDQCRGRRLASLGAGTERVEEEIRVKFPEARVARFDTDAIKNPKAYYRVLEQFAKHELDLLIGTQMIAKGLHLPKVTLVGVVNADTALHIPDFRAAERTYQLLTQVAGRAGRGERKGTVVVQTYMENHYSIQTAAARDDRKFYETELGFRQMVQYPPFSHLVRIGVQGHRLAAVEAAAGKAAQACQSPTLSVNQSVEVLGPSAAPMNRIRGEFRYHVLLKHPEIEALQETVRRTGMYDGMIADGVRHVLDVDPLMVI